MKKWWIMIATVMVAVVILAVCIYGLPSWVPGISPSGTGNSQSGTTQPPATTEKPLPWDPYTLLEYKYRSNPDHSYKITRQILPETVNNPEGLPVLKWVCLITAGDQVWNEAAVVELNQMLADKKLPYRVQFTILSTSRLDLLPVDWFTHPDVQKELEDADLIYGDYTAQEMEQWLRPITDHIYGEAQPALADTLPDLLSWYSFEANGELYGIPKTPRWNYQQGWSVDPDFMKKYDLTTEDFQKNFWEMDDLFAEIYKENGNQPFLNDAFSGRTGGLITSHGLYVNLPMDAAMEGTAYQGIALCFCVDLQAEKPTVVNMLETDYFSKVHEAVLRYLKAGYMDRDCNEVSFNYSITSSEPYVSAYDGYYQIPCGPKSMKGLSRAYMTGISAKSPHSKEALSLLEQIMTDDALRLQLCYGKEGRDYTLEDGVYTLITQGGGSRYYMDYLSPQAVYFDFTSTDADTGYLVPSTTDGLIVKREGKTRLECYREDSATTAFCYLPEILDCSSLDAEMNALLQVIRDYYPMFTNAEYYSEDYYQRMLRDMEEAGMSTVITELQRQLDAWIAEHPDWDPLGRN